MVLGPMAVEPLASAAVKHHARPVSCSSSSSSCSSTSSSSAEQPQTLAVLQPRSHGVSVLVNPDPAEVSVAAVRVVASVVTVGEHDPQSLAVATVKFRHPQSVRVGWRGLSFRRSGGREVAAERLTQSHALRRSHVRKTYPCRGRITSASSSQRSRKG